MKAFGTALIVLGLLLMVFDLAGCQSDRPSALTDWINNWGKNTALGIRLGMVVLGFILVSVSGKKLK